VRAREAKKKKKKGPNKQTDEKGATDKEGKTLLLLLLLLRFGRRFSLHGYHVVWNVCPIYNLWGVVLFAPSSLSIPSLLFLSSLTQRQSPPSPFSSSPSNLNRRQCLTGRKEGRRKKSIPEVRELDPFIFKGPLRDKRGNTPRN
jgi:hypothetical protein